MSELDEVRKLVDVQAEDEGLWFVAQTAPEAYLQHHLRILHALVEHYTVDPE
jgi:cell division ATPase FtsA